MQQAEMGRAEPEDAPQRVTGLSSGQSCAALCPGEQVAGAQKGQAHFEERASGVRQEERSGPPAGG